MCRSFALGLSLTLYLTWPDMIVVAVLSKPDAVVVADWHHEDIIAP